MYHSVGLGVCMCGYVLYVYECDVHCVCSRGRECGFGRVCVMCVIGLSVFCVCQCVCCVCVWCGCMHGC